MYKYIVCIYICTHCIILLYIYIHIHIHTYIYTPVVYIYIYVYTDYPTVQNPAQGDGSSLRLPQVWKSRAEV